MTTSIKATTNNTRYPLGLSSYILSTPFSDTSLHEFAHVRELGYDQFEICVDDPDTLSSALTRSAAEESGLSVAVTGAFGPSRDISHEDPAVQRNAKDYLRAVVDFAAAVDSPYVAGPMFTAVAVKLLQTPQERHRQLQRAAGNLREIADYAGERDVKLAMEPLNRFETHLINTVEQALELIELVDAPNIGMVLDTFHMNIEEKDLGAAIRLAGDRVFAFQASENDRGTPGSGNIDWPSLWTALDDIDYAGTVVVESFIATTEIAHIGGLWRPVAASMEQLAIDALAFLRDELRV
ncbi:sugar phosphate isomerase/epimerase [Mycolicibacterium sp. YH-1]|uniref:sugar phosphate isomerase/epimerase family protein n=1 Tax=Mycolicibacterium sp. YH-1 TaxID=2908837 RepID=UPI001F4BF2FA|nr:sugar phosphate isomerase/epimerase family protein [Mycolicibacterium sp. YH-1]UNB52947.1 sugar phosphate isomerase/epimerase [Mycolicibacterium sp. YH-1]